MTFHGKYVPHAHAVLDADFDDLLEGIFVPPARVKTRTERYCVGCRRPIINRRSKFCSVCFDKRDRRIGTT